VTDQAGDGGLRHAAWFYRIWSDYLAAIEAFVATGTERDEPVLVAVPSAQFPAGWRRPSGRDVVFVDMAELGRNPARILQAVRDFSERYSGRRVRYLAEPAWAARSAAELQEAARHEALLNLAFADADITIRCPYNDAALHQSVLAQARATHPMLLSNGAERSCEDYLAPADYLALLGKPLLAPAGAVSLAYGRDLRPVRVLVARAAEEAGLPQSRCTDLVIAASEVAANSLRHAGGTGVVRLWSTETEVLCQLEDSGVITDPLAGHQRPPGNLPGGQGLWLVNQVCDLAEIRTGHFGTTIRLHMAFSR